MVVDGFVSWFVDGTERDSGDGGIVRTYVIVEEIADKGNGRVGGAEEILDEGCAHCRSDRRRLGCGAPHSL